MLTIAHNLDIICHKEFKLDLNIVDTHINSDASMNRLLL